MPVQQDKSEEFGMKGWERGMFWDGRVTELILGDVTPDKFVTMSVLLFE